MKHAIAEMAYDEVSRDATGISFMAWSAKERMDALLAGCGVQVGDTDDYTRTLVQYYIEFAPEMNGGSNADFTGRACVRAVEGYVLYDASDNVISELSGWIESSALYPEREFDVLSEAGVL